MLKITFQPKFKKESLPKIIVEVFKMEYMGSDCITLLYCLETNCICCMYSSETGWRDN